MGINVESSEWKVLQNWKRDGGSFILVQLKAETVMLASGDVPISVIGRFVDRSVGTVRGWLRDWQDVRLASVVTGHAGNERAAKLTSSQKAVVREALASPPSEAGVVAEFWDVPALETLVSILLEILADITDPWDPRGVRHSLVAVLGVAVMVIAGPCELSH